MSITKMVPNIGIEEKRMGLGYKILSPFYKTEKGNAFHTKVIFSKQSGSTLGVIFIILGMYSSFHMIDG